MHISSNDDITETTRMARRHHRKSTQEVDKPRVQNFKIVADVAECLQDVAKLNNFSK